MLGETTRVAEVQYFTRLAIQDEANDAARWSWKNVAVVTMFSLPDPNLFKMSYQTVYACQRLENNVRVVDITSITGVVGMAPHAFPGLGYRHFMVERPGLDIATFGVSYEGDNTQDDMDDDDDNHDN